MPRKAERIPSYSKDVYSLHEKNDCFVRAVSNATGLSYRDSYALAEKHGRKKNRGSYPETIVQALDEINYQPIGLFGSSKAAKYFGFWFRNAFMDRKYPRITLKQFLKDLPFGKYIVVIRGHALAVVDGKIIDTFDNKANVEVICAFAHMDMKLI